MRWYPRLKPGPGIRAASLAGILVILSGLVAACGGAASTTAPAAVGDSSVTSTGGSEWDDTLAKAKKEAQLTWSTNATASYGLQPILDEFTRKTGVKITFDVAPGGPMVDRTLAARQGGKYEMNLFSTSAGGSGQRMVAANALQPLEPLLFLPDVVDASNWWKDQHWYADAGNKFLFSYAAEATPSSQRVLYNKNMVTQADLDALKSDWDWLQPKWAGKIVALDPTGPISVNGYPDSYRFPWLGPDYAKKLFDKQLNVTFVRDFRLAVDGIVSGKWAFGIMLGGLGDSDLLDLIKQGAPIAISNKAFAGEPLLLNASEPTQTIALADKAPSPNAAKLFLNWFLSKEGQTFRQESAAQVVSPTLRTDVTATRMINSALAVDPKVDYLFYSKDPAYSVESGVKAYAAVKSLYTEMRGS
jgi:ABC-type Fe3+ transport system substrate-binding protein